MGCIDASGELTPSAARILRALETGGAASDVARAADLPLPRVRGALRELVAAGLAREDGDRFRRTATGDEQLATLPAP
jgi:DNA-binding IclR family transcriptional regulator